MSQPFAAHAVVFEHVTRAFGEIKAVDDVSVQIEDGEFFTMLGPSGSGKTTCLRMMAGFDRPTSGEVYLHAVKVTQLPPYERDVNTVFQDYALFPHMTVGENIAYGPMLKKMPKGERERRVTEMLELVRLPGYARRKPAQLSGGQRQRVALARALINQPRVLLLDEPLGALDLKLRQDMQIELKGLQQRLGITFVFVTHDQEEALSMSNRIAVFNLGKIEQIGTPAQLYEQPATAFVAGFVGTSNMLAGEFARRLAGAEGKYALRPEKIHLGRADAPLLPGAVAVDGTVLEVIYLGLYTRYLVQVDGGSQGEQDRLAVVQQNLETSATDAHATNGQRCRLQWERTHMLRLNA